MYRPSPILPSLSGPCVFFHAMEILFQQQGKDSCLPVCVVVVDERYTCVRKAMQKIFSVYKIFNFDLQQLGERFDIL